VLLTVAHQLVDVFDQHARHLFLTQALLHQSEHLSHREHGLGGQLALIGLTLCILRVSQDFDHLGIKVCGLGHLEKADHVLAHAVRYLLIPVALKAYFDVIAAQVLALKHLLGVFVCPLQQLVVKFLVGNGFEPVNFQAFDLMVEAPATLQLDCFAKSLNHDVSGRQLDDDLLMVVFIEVEVLGNDLVRLDLLLNHLLVTRLLDLLRADISPGVALSDLLSDFLLFGVLDDGLPNRDADFAAGYFIIFHDEGRDLALELSFESSTSEPASDPCLNFYD